MTAPDDARVTRAAGRPAARGATIGAVLDELRTDFPDISISKIRFLEAQGLVTPERRPSGYRVYSGADLDRLRYVLTMQRDRFWPLKVIADALDAMDRGLTPQDVDGGQAPGARPQVPAAHRDESLPTAARLRETSTLRLTRQEVAESAGLPAATLTALETFGLIAPDASGHLDADDLAVARAAAALAEHGVEPRHLRPFRTAADREVGLVQQIVVPARARSRRGSAGRSAGGGASSDADPADELTSEVLAQCIALHTALVRAGLRRG